MSIRRNAGSAPATNTNPTPAGSKAGKIASLEAKDNKRLNTKFKKFFKPNIESEKNHEQTLFGFGIQAAIMLVGGIALQYTGKEFNQTIGFQFAVVTFVLAGLYALVNSKGSYTPNWKSLGYWLQNIVLVVGMAILIQNYQTALSTIYLKTNIIAIIAAISFLPVIEFVVYDVILNGFIRFLLNIVLSIVGSERFATAKAFISICIGLYIVYTAYSWLSV